MTYLVTLMTYLVMLTTNTLKDTSLAEQIVLFKEYDGPLDRSCMVDPQSYFLFQPALHN